MPRGRRTSAGSGNTIQKEVAALFALGHRADQTADAEYTEVTAVHRC